MRVLAFLLCSSGLFAQMVWFEPNRGQVAGNTQWIGRSKGAYLYITGNEVVYANRQNIHMRLVGASKRATVEGAEPSGGYSSYFTGRDESTWFTGIPHYAKLRYKDVYPGIDMLYYASGRNVEYDFVVAPGADPDRIELAFSEPVTLDRGDLLVAGLRQHRPRVLQNGREIEASYRLTEEGHIQLAVASFDRSKELTIDPVLEFSTYLGGPGEESLHTVTTDAGGNIYVAGGTQSPVSPGLDPFHQSNLAGASPILLKMSSDGQRVLFYVELSTNAWDFAWDAVLDSAGNILMFGSTNSANLPLKNPLQTDFKAFYWTTFISKIAKDGKSLLFSTYFGGSQWDSPSRMVIDEQDNAYFTGYTQSSDFPVLNAYQPRFGGGGTDCYLFKLTSANTIAYSTYFGGSGLDSCTGLARDADGNVIVVGSSTGDLPLQKPIQTEWTPRLGFPTPFLFRFDRKGNLIQSTWFGGPTHARAMSVTTDRGGSIYAVGDVYESTFPTRNAFQTVFPGAQTGYIVKFNPAVSDVVYATYFGGTSGVNGIRDIAVDASGFIYVAGYAGSADFPTKDPLQAWRGGGHDQTDCFVAKLAPSGSALVYSTFMGGGSNDDVERITLAGSGGVLVAGTTGSSDFPVKRAYQNTYGGGYDGVLFKITDTTPPVTSPLSATPGHLTFGFTQGGPVPAVQMVAVSGGAYAASTSANWIRVAANGSSVVVSIDPASLAPGAYTGTIFLSPPLGAPASIDVTLAVLAPAPALISVAPTQVPIGSDDTLVTVHGSGFVKGATLYVNGSLWDATPLLVVDSSTLNFTLPANYLSVQYNHTIAVRNPDSGLSNLLSLTVGIPAPAFTAASVTNAASFANGPIAPGEIVTIFGTNLIGTVTFDDIPATVVYSSATQMSVTVPYAVAGPSTSLKIGSSVPVKLDVVAAVPGIFAAVTDQGILTLYATGCGMLTNDTLPRCVQSVQVTINGIAADVLYAGIAPGLPAGANQINVRLPDGLFGPVRIVLKAGDAASAEFSSTFE